MAVVVITGPPVITGSFHYQDITFYGWTFPVIVDGQAGVYTVWIDTEDPDAEPSAEEGVLQDLEDDPGAMGGVADGDNYGGLDGIDGFDGDDDGDGVLAGNGSGYGDSA